MSCDPFNTGAQGTCNSRRSRSGGRNGTPADLFAMQKKFGSADYCNWEMIRYQYYDYIRLNPAGVTQLSFFNNPVGTPDAVSSIAKSLEQTNLTRTRTFGQVYFVVHQIKTHVAIAPKVRQTVANLKNASLFSGLLDEAMPGIANLLDSGVLNIKLGQKDYFDIPKPFKLCPPGFGVEIQQMAAPTGKAAMHVRQSTLPADVYSLTPEQMIEPEQSIEATIDFPMGSTPNFSALTNAPTIDIGLIFEGYLARPVQ